MKFRYILKNKHTGYIHKKVYTLNQIQDKGLGKLFDVENYEIIKINKFTALKSDNLKEVCEDDIIKNGVNKKYIIKFINYSFYFIAVSDNQKYSFNQYLTMLDKANIWFEIIGNIHENSDLLN